MRQSAVFDMKAVGLPSKDISGSFTMCNKNWLLANLQSLGTLIRACMHYLDSENNDITVRR